MLKFHLLFAASAADKSWIAENSTLVVGIVGILVSGVVGPAVAAWLAGRRERAKDLRQRVVAQRDDLREVVDDAATALGGAVPRLRPALDAQRKGAPLSPEARDFLSELFTLGQRLRLRVRDADVVVRAYDHARIQLIAVSRATESQAGFDTAAKLFEEHRERFLEKAREALDAPIP